MQAVAQQIVAAPVKVKQSQQAVIDQLHQQCQQNDSVIMLHGGDGTGKTTIAELFLEQASDYAECAFVTANERSTMDRLRAQVLNQLFGTISLSDETLSRQIQRQQPLHHAVIVIDNGEHLPDAFLAECVSTVTQLSAIGQKVSVVVVADSRWAYQQKPASHLRVQGPVMLEVQPLNKDEQVRFIQSLLPERQQKLWNFDRIQQFLATINGYPGEIQQRLQLALATQAHRYKDQPPKSASNNSGIDESLEDDAVALSQSSSNQGRPIKLTSVLLLAGVLTIAVAGFLNKDRLMSLWQSLSAPKAELTAVADETNGETTKAETNTVPAQPKQVDANEKTSPATTQLPSFEPLSTQQLELMPEDLATSYRNALDDLNRVAAAENDPRELSVGLIKEAPTPKAEPTKAEPTQTDNNLAPFETTAISQRQGSNYALQVGIISTPQLLADFRQDYDLTDITEVYQRDDGAYVIIYGNFDSIEQAHAAVTELPAAIQQQEPWAKSYAAMQKEINLSNAQ